MSKKKEIERMRLQIEDRKEEIRDLKESIRELTDPHYCVSDKKMRVQCTDDFAAGLLPRLISVSDKKMRVQCTENDLGHLRVNLLHDGIVFDFGVNYCPFCGKETGE